jgi:hypothetical protein
LVDTCCAEILPKNSFITVERPLSDITGIVFNITLTKASIVMSVPVDSSDTQYYKELKELALFL